VTDENPLTDEDRQAILEKETERHVSNADQYVPGSPPSLSAGNAYGSWVLDIRGEKFLDFGPGGCVSFLGHNHQPVVQTVTEQAQHFLNAGPGFTDNITSEYALLLSNLVTVRGENPQTLVCSGIEEAKAIVAKIGTHPLSGQGPVTLSPVSPTGVLMDGGLFQDAAHRARAQDKVIVSDETVAGFGRTGKFLAYEYLNYVPDIVLLGPSGGGGMPFAAVVAPKDLWDRVYFTPGLMHMHPVVCAAAREALEGITPALMENAVESGKYIQMKVGELSAQFPAYIRGCDGVGLLQQLYISDRSKAERFRRDCWNKGLILGENLVMTPPLTITAVEIDMGIDILAEVLMEWEEEEMR